MGETWDDERESMGPTGVGEKFPDSSRRPDCDPELGFVEVLDVVGELDVLRKELANVNVLDLERLYIARV